MDDPIKKDGVETPESAPETSMVNSETNTMSKGTLWTIIACVVLLGITIVGSMVMSPKAVTVSNMHYETRTYYAVPAGTVYFDAFGNRVHNVYPGMRVYPSPAAALAGSLTDAIILNNLLSNNAYRPLTSNENIEYNKRRKAYRLRQYKKDPVKFKKRHGPIDNSRKSIAARKTIEKRRTSEATTIIKRQRLAAKTKTEKQFKVEDKKDTKAIAAKVKKGGFGKAKVTTSKKPVTKSKAQLAAEAKAKAKADAAAKARAARVAKQKADAKAKADAAKLRNQRRSSSNNSSYRGSSSSSSSSRSSGRRR